MDITKEEFLSWKSDKVTNIFMQHIAQRVQDAKDILSVSAGLDPSNDRLLVGLIKGFTDVLEVDYAVSSGDASDSAEASD